MTTAAGKHSLADRFGHHAAAGWLVHVHGGGDQRAGFATDRRQLPELPAAVDHTTAEPEPARSAGHQPVHPATGRIRRRPAAAQHQRLAGHPGLAAADRQATQALNYVGKTAVVSGSTAALANSTATWQLSVPTASTVNITITNSTGQTVFTGSYNASAGNNQPFDWNGQGNDGTQWPDGNYTLTATAKDSGGNTVAITSADPGHRQFGRSHPVAAFAVDQRPDLHGQPDPEHRELTETPRSASPIGRSAARPNHPNQPDPGVEQAPGCLSSRHFQGNSH